MRAKNLENIVDCHMAAQARREQGLPIWDRKIDIKSILFREMGNESTEYVVETSHAIGRLMRAKLPKGLLNLPGDEADFELMDIVEHLEDLQANDEAQANFNDNLSCLYDWADHNRVWLGSK
jgi:hypothetical protein